MRMCCISRKIESRLSIAKSKSIMPCVDPVKPNLVNYHKWAFYIFTTILTIQVYTTSKTSSDYCRSFEALQDSPVVKNCKGFCINVSKIGAMYKHSKEHMYCTACIRKVDKGWNPQYSTFSMYFIAIFADAEFFVDVSGHILQISQNWGFSMDFLNHMVFYQVFLLSPLQVYSTELKKL